MARRALGADVRAGERNRRDEAERAARYRDERGCAEVRVDEARRGAGSLPAREREADDVEDLERERQRGPDDEDAEPIAKGRARRPHRVPRHPRTSREHRDPDQRHEKRDRAVQGHSPGDRDDPVRLDPGEDEREPRHAPGRVAERGDRVVVEGGEAAREHAGEEVGAGGRHDPAKGFRCRVVRDPGAVTGEKSREQRRGELRDEHERYDDRGHSQRETGELAREASVVLRPREVRKHRDANRLRADRDDEEDTIRGQEPVGLVGAAELAGDDDADRGRDARDHEQRRSGEGAARQRTKGGAQAGRNCTLAHRRGSVRTMSNDSLWTGGSLDDLRREFGDVYEGRTVLVTGADGFMGSHLTDALVELGATVHAFVRATSSGALNNIGHLRNRLKVHFADLTDKTSVDYLIRELKGTASDRPYVFHLGAQAHVGESWHRPYETVMANTIGTLNLLQSVVDVGLELEKFDTAGTSEEYGNVREAVTDHHDFDADGGLILHERSPLNPKSIYATAKVAADFLTMNYFDAFRVPGVVTRMFNNYGPRQNPRYVTGTIITQALTRDTIELGPLDPMRDFCFCADGVRGHLTVAAHGIPGDVYVYGQGANITMRDWVDLILRVGEAGGFWPGDREVVSSEARFRPGTSEVLALRVGHEKLTRETGWEPKVSWEDGVLQTIRWYAENRDRWIGRVDWMPTGTPLATK